MAFPSAIGCIVIGLSPITSGGPCIDTESPLVARTIPAYLYWQYRDDDNLQAFVDSYNAMTQDYVDWYISLNLPIYTQSPITGAFLDWVGQGLYGYPRPVLGEGYQRLIGPLNTYSPNGFGVVNEDGSFERILAVGLNQRRILSNARAIRVNDDLYRRSIAWHFFKGYGHQFNVRYLKRRIMQWLTGPDGIDPKVDQTYRISVSFGACCQVNITLIIFKSVWQRGAVPNTITLNDRGAPTRSYGSAILNHNEIVVTIIGDQFEFGDQLKEAIDEGFLELPFQYNYVVTVQH